MEADSRFSKKHVLAAVAAAAVIAIVYFSYITHDDSTTARIVRPSRYAVSKSSTEHLSTLNLTDPFDYRRQCVRPLKDSKLVREQGSAFYTRSTLVPGTSVNSHSTDDLSPTHICQDTLVIHIPVDDALPPLNPSMLMLGVATTLARLTVSLPEWAGYLSNTGVLVVVILRDQRDPNAPAIAAAKKLARLLRIDVQLICQAALLPASTEWPDEFSEAQTNFQLALAFDRYKEPETKWFGVVDDDTFIVSIQNILHTLEPYDPSQPYYIGAEQEDFIKIWLGHYDLPGGAGFFVSAPLLDLLLPNFSTCMKNTVGFGDQMWGECTIDHASINATTIKGLHQFQMDGSLAGWYESGEWPISTIHHWKTFHHFPVPKAYLVTLVAGLEGFLARYVFNDNYVLTNGHSIVHYPAGVPHLNETEITWQVRSPDPNVVSKFWLNFGPLRAKLPEEEKESWVLEHATYDGNEVKQFYVRRGHGPDSVIELDWSLSF